MNYASIWRHSRATLLCLCFFLFGLALTAPCLAQDRDYLDELLSEARARDLHQERYWQILLHYKPALGGEKSLIDDPDFFLAADGKTNPAHELEATLEGLFRGGVDSPRCRFVARYDWLKEALDINESQLPEVACQEFDEAYAKVDPQSAALVFPGTHNNSPASMFGHTLISIRGPYSSRLLAWAVSYSAFTNASNGFTYAVNGIFGRYPGYFSVLPYYEKLRTYSDMERRDVWEYELNLTPDEVRRLFLHTWELREIASDYYFFDENCAYNLLFLFEAARPSLNLTDQCRPWVIPIDTVRIAEEAGLVEKAVYRPSKATRIAHIASYMDHREKDLAQQLIRLQLTPQDLTKKELTAQAQVRILDVAAEALEFDFIRQRIDQDSFRRRYVTLLGARSRLGSPEEAYEEIPPPPRPDAGHGSNRMGLGGGVRDGESFAELRIRPAYHNLLDSDDGYLAGSQIDFTNLVLRHYVRQERTELFSLDLVNIVSLSPRNAFFKPVSWKVETGFEQKMFPGGDDHLIYSLNPGGGFAFGSDRRMAYVLLETEAQVGGRFRHGYAAGLGGSTGLLASIGDHWKVHLWGRKVYFEVGASEEHHQELAVHLDQNLRISSSQSLSLQMSRRKESGVTYSEAGMSWNLFW